MVKQFGIGFPYRARRSVPPFDDTHLTDECQLPVYLRALGLMKKHGLNTVLDVGCGSAYKLVTYLGEYDTVGLETADTVAFLKEKYPDRKWEVSDFRPHKRGADVVICADVIEHLANPDELLDFLQALSFRFLVLSTPARDVKTHWWKMRRWFGNPKNPYHFREWTFREFGDYIAGHGFRVVEHEVVHIGQRTQMIVCAGADSE